MDPDGRASRPSAYTAAVNQFDRAWNWEFRRDRKLVLWLAGITIAAFVAQIFASGSGGHGWIVRSLALSAAGVQRGRVWQLLTYMLLHGGVGHLLMNMLGLILLGPEVERRLGAFHFVALYIGSGVLGGLGYILIDPRHPCMGASGAVFGVMAAFAALFPRRPMMLVFLPFFTLPAWLMVTGILLIELGYLVQGSFGGIAHSAHLAGAVAGAVYARIAGAGAGGAAAAWFERIRFAMRSRRRSAALRDAGADDAETDRILDKIARQGLASLTPTERRRLEAASRRLRRWER